MATAAPPRAAPRGTSTSSYELIPVAHIIVGDNVRADVGDVDELKASIEQHGILQPLRVEPGDDGIYLLKIGHRRLAAAKLAGLLHVPAIIDSKPALGADRSIQQLVENVQRRDLNALEEAKALRGILDASKGMTQEQLADKVGRSRPAVTNLLRILDADDAVQAMVADGRLTAAHAKAIAGLPQKAQLELAKHAVEDGWSAHDVENQLRWEREQAERDAGYAEKAAKRAESTLGWLKKKKVPTSARLFVSREQHGPIRKAGWKDIHDSYGDGRYFRRSEVKDCDCVAFECRYDGTWDPVCVAMKHRRAFLADKAAADAAKRRDGLEVLAIGRAQVVAQIRDRIATSASVHRLLLWSVLREGYNHSDYARALGKRLLGKELTTTADTDLLWKMLVELPDEQVLAELGAAVADKVLPDLTGDYGEWRGKSHTAIRRMVVDWLSLDPQLIDGKKHAKAPKKKAAKS